MPHFGEIVRIINLPDSGGRNPKPYRPCVVITSDDDLARGAPIVVLGISTLLPGPLHPTAVPLAWKDGGHPRTGLKKRCAVFITWKVVVGLDRVISLGKTTSPKERLAIAEALRKLDQGLI